MDSGQVSGIGGKNLPVLASVARVYAIDLIGFGASAKPKPGEKITYTFETWGQQLADFCRERHRRSGIFLVGNSRRLYCGDAKLPVSNPDIVLGVALLNCSLRLLQ